jgi:hypothetical protein
MTAHLVSAKRDCELRWWYKDTWYHPSAALPRTCRSHTDLLCPSDMHRCDDLKMFRDGGASQTRGN